MSEHTPEVVPPSSEPDSATATGTGDPSDGVTPPEDPSETASTSGLGTVEDQQGSDASGGAPYSLDGDPNPTEPASPSGT
jgi:hypothetical protein